VLRTSSPSLMERKLPRMITPTEFSSRLKASPMTPPALLENSTISPDITPPVTASDLKAAYAGPVTIRLTPTDDASNPAKGVQGTFYRVDGGTQTSGTVIAVAQPGSGTATHTVQFWSIDGSGNTEAAHAGTFTVTADLVAPISTTSLPYYLNSSYMWGFWAYFHPVDPAPAGAPSLGSAGVRRLGRRRSSALGLSHLSAVLRKLQLSNRHQLTAWANQRRLI